MAKKIIIGVIILLIAGGVIWLKVSSDQKASYQTTPVTRGDLTSAVQATGTVSPTVSVTVGAQVSGKIVKLFVDYNSPVKKGDLLALIDPASYQTLVSQAGAQVNNDTAALGVAQQNINASQSSMSASLNNLQAQEAQLKKDQALAQNAKLNFQRMESLGKKDLVAKSDVDAARYTYLSQQATLEQDKAKIAQARQQYTGSAISVEISKGQYQSSAASLARSRAQLEQAGTNLNYTRIVSPVDGVVVARNVDVGQTVVSSFQAPSLFVIAQDLREMQIEAQVDESSISKVKDGQAVEFNVAAFPTETFKGVVKQIRINPVTSQNVVNYDVMVNVANPKIQLLPGMTATLNFIIARKTGVLQIPNQALRYVPSDKSSNGKPKAALSPSPSPSAALVGGFAKKKAAAEQGTNLWVLENGKQVRKKVELGISDGLNTEVISGLSEGEEVITGSTSKNGAAGGRSGVGRIMH